jgi:ribosomal-protein-alanine N-acetyltransferase
MNIETERLSIREVTVDDAHFICELLNTPNFVRYIADRGVRTNEDAVRYIETRFVESYRVNGFGLYLVAESESGESAGVCGFVKRGELPGPDIGFAFLPQFERRGFGFESAVAMLKFGRGTLGFSEVFAITSLDNVASMSLLGKLGFSLIDVIDGESDERLNLFRYHYS